jgi:hypothetical protein
LVAVYVACFKGYADVLAPGEVGTLPVIAADRRQARTVMRYITGFLDAVPMLARMVEARTAETVTLASRVVVEVHTASFRAVRGYTLVGAVLDEVAFWPSDEAGANPDAEIIAALRPGMATVAGALLLCISSPHARRGALYDAHRGHYAQDGDPVLVWQADTASMNPLVDPQVIADAYTADVTSALAEFGAQFRTDVEMFITREVVEAAVAADRHELAPIETGVKYHGFVDPSGGSQDSMTLAVAHLDVRSGRAVLDCVREWRPPFNPSEVVLECATTLALYGIARVVGDRYGGEWPSAFAHSASATNRASARKAKSISRRWPG